MTTTTKEIATDTLDSEMTESTAIVIKTLIQSGVIPIQLNLLIAKSLRPFGDAITFGLLKDESESVWLFNCKLNQSSIFVGGLIVFAGFNQSLVGVTAVHATVSNCSFLIKIPSECINQPYPIKTYNITLPCEEIS